MARPVVALAVLSLTAAPASADVLKLYGDVHGGGMLGKGIGGDAMAQESSFFAQSKGGTYGFGVGGRFLFIDAHISHHQFPHDGTISTWTQFNAGLDFEVDTGGPQAKKDHNGAYIEIGAWLGFGVATGAQVDPPLDNSEVSDKGFMLEGRIGFGKHLSKNFDIGLQVPASWGYIFRNGNGAAANDVSSQYQSIQLEALLVFRANVKVI
jgi:hypothetical protein